jgi:hypothetical protein
MTSFLSNSNRIAKTEFIREKEGFHAAGYVPRELVDFKLFSHLT